MTEPDSALSFSRCFDFDDSMHSHHPPWPPCLQTHTKTHSHAYTQQYSSVIFRVTEFMDCNSTLTFSYYYSTQNLSFTIKLIFCNSGTVKKIYEDIQRNTWNHFCSVNQSICMRSMFHLAIFEPRSTYKSLYTYKPCTIVASEHATSLQLEITDGTDACCPQIRDRQLFFSGPVPSIQGKR